MPDSCPGVGGWGVTLIRALFIIINIENTPIEVSVQRRKRTGRNTYTKKSTQIRQWQLFATSHQDSCRARAGVVRRGGTPDCGCTTSHPSSPPPPPPPLVPPSVDGLVHSVAYISVKFYCTLSISANRLVNVIRRVGRIATPFW